MPIGLDPWECWSFVLMVRRYRRDPAYVRAVESRFNALQLAWLKAVDRRAQ